MDSICFNVDSTCIADIIAPIYGAPRAEPEVETDSVVVAILSLRVSELRIEETVRKPFLRRSGQGESRKGPATVKERACKDEKIERTRSQVFDAAVIYTAG